MQKLVESLAGDDVVKTKSEEELPKEDEAAEDAPEADEAKPAEATNGEEKEE